MMHTRDADTGRSGGAYSMYIRRQSCHPARAGCTLHIATVLRRLTNKMSEAASLARWACQESGKMIIQQYIFHHTSSPSIALTGMIPAACCCLIDVLCIVFGPHCISSQHLLLPFLRLTRVAASLGFWAWDREDRTISS